MNFVNEVAVTMASMTDQQLLDARDKIKSTYTFYWKITQEPGIDLKRPRGKSAQENCNEINQVGLALKAEIDKRNIQTP